MVSRNSFSDFCTVLNKMLVSCFAVYSIDRWHMLQISWRKRSWIYRYLQSSWEQRSHFKHAGRTQQGNDWHWYTRWCKLISVWITDPFFSFIILTTKMLCFCFAYPEMARSECDKQFTKILLPKAAWASLYEWWVSSLRPCQRRRLTVCGKSEHNKSNQDNNMRDEEMTFISGLNLMKSIVENWLCSFVVLINFVEKSFAKSWYTLVKRE